MILAIQQAMYGMEYHRRMLNYAAENIAHVGMNKREGAGPPAALAHEIVTMLAAKHGFTANTKTLRVADEMIGSLLDVFV